MDLKLIDEEHARDGWEIFNLEVMESPACKISRVRLFNRNDEAGYPSIVVYRGFRKPARRFYDVPCYIARRWSDDAVLTKTQSDRTTDLKGGIKRAITQLHAIKPGWNQRKHWRAEQQILGDLPTDDQVKFRRKQIEAFLGREED